MIPIDYNLPTAYRGDSYGPITFVPINSNGSYLNLSGYDINVHVKNKKNCAIVLSWSTDDGSVEIKNLISGAIYSGAQFVLNKVGACNMQMPPNSYVYDIQISNNNNTSTYFRGELPVSGDVTMIMDCDCKYVSGSADRMSESYCSMSNSFFAYRI